MNKKMVTLILVILISFCFISIVVAENVSHDGNNAINHYKTIGKDKNIDNTKDNNNTTDNNKTIDKNKTTNKNKTDDKSKKNYILAKGKGNDIKFSDGSRGFILDYSKSPASSGDEFKRVSTSKASNSNTLKLAVIECYKQNSTGQIGKIMADFVKTGSSNTKVGEAVAASHEKVSDHEVVKIDDHTEAVFDFEVLKSVSGNESDYFAYKVSFKTINDDEDINQGNNLTNVTNTTIITNTTNATNTTNLTNITQQIDNETNVTFLNDLYDYLAFLANALYDSWKPIIDTLINDFLMFYNALEELTTMFEDFMMEIQSLMDAIGQLLNMLESIYKELVGLLKLLGVLLTAIQQLINFIGALLNFIAGLISAIISLIQQLLGLLFVLINQIVALIQAILDFLNSVGSYLGNVIKNSVIIITTFVIIVVGALVYNRIK